ncbi:phage tail tape measure protein [Hoeflea sp.]|uniref:phage tail tape measure protein n=1 Tax=Hoeflea sp. TaxID=1940281 RepID=UPI003A8EB8A6
MSNRNMNLDVIVRMRDMLSSPLRRLTAGLRSIGNVARSIGLVGTAIAAISFMGPINQAAAFQQQLLDIAGTANLSGQAAFDFVDEAKGKYEELALLVGQYSDTVASGAGEMIAAGVNEALVNASIGSIGRAATAANAEFSDMSKVATSLLQTLKLPASQLDDALGGLVVAGKEGAFELKDMARYFPTLTSQMAKFGVTGREAVNFLGAALQIARKGTSDPAEAANNLKNFLSKILAPQTIKKFAEAGVDIEAVMRDAATKGINPVEAVMQKIVKLSGVSGTEIEKLMKAAKDNGLEGADALGHVREQLEKIHGAGALGDLFSDVQVMDFLIPFLGNVDEYKRIKDEVAKATGAIIGEDFETQMLGLNRQLITFKEIGKQGAREVGLAFGTWLPMINENLAGALKWMRELDESTGGMVRQALTFAGAAVLVAAGLGALGIILPIIGVGFSALLALISPVGILLAGIAAGAVHIYKNWATYSPRVTRLWDRAKRGFFDLADGVRDGGRRIISAGREFAARFGPSIRSGLNTAWADIKDGWNNLQTFFKGFAKALDLDFDLSALTIDNAKLAAFEALDLALKGIKAGWEALKDFGTGFAPSLGKIGENMGSSLNSLVRFGDAMGRLAHALASMISIDTSSLDGFFRQLGGLYGAGLELFTSAMAAGADATARLVETLADLAEGKITWKSLVPPDAMQMWNEMTDSIDLFITRAEALPGEMYAIGLEVGQRMIDGIKSKFDELIAWFGGLPARILSAIGKIDFSSILPGWVVNLLPEGPRSPRGAPGPATGPQPPPLPANNNMLPARGALNGESKANVAVTIKVDGPGKVTSATSDNKAVKVGNNGRIVGRV